MSSESVMAAMVNRSLDRVNEVGMVVARIKAVVYGLDAEQYRDEACRHVVDQPYADNRYARLLDEIRAIVDTDLTGRDA